jgi:hypothetical protein
MPVESGTENWGSTTSQRFPESSKASKRGFCDSLQVRILSKHPICDTEATIAAARPR